MICASIYGTLTAIWRASVSFDNANLFSVVKCRFGGLLPSLITCMYFPCKFVLSLAFTDFARNDIGWGVYLPGMLVVFGVCFRYMPIEFCLYCMCMYFEVAYTFFLLFNYVALLYGFKLALSLTFT